MYSQAHNLYNDNMKEIYYPMVGQKIKILRNEAGFTQEQIGKPVGFPLRFWDILRVEHESYR